MRACTSMYLTTILSCIAIEGYIEVAIILTRLVEAAKSGLVDSVVIELQKVQEK
jgi:hypothetical protein